MQRSRGKEMLAFFQKGKYDGVSERNSESGGRRIRGGSEGSGVGGGGLVGHGQDFGICYVMRSQRGSDMTDLHLKGIALRFEHKLHKRRHMKGL